MYFVKINDIVVEYFFNTKKDAVHFLIDELERRSFEDPVLTLKNSEKIQDDYREILRTEKYTIIISQMFEYAKCTICSSGMRKVDKLSCNHTICLECLKKLRKNECPVCRRELYGDVITDEILGNILQRTEIDEFQRRQEDEIMALATGLGYNPNELYQ